MFPSLMGFKELKYQSLKYYHQLRHYFSALVKLALRIFLELFFKSKYYISSKKVRIALRTELKYRKKD